MLRASPRSRAATLRPPVTDGPGHLRQRARRRRRTAVDRPRRAPPRRRRAAGGRNVPRMRATSIGSCSRRRAQAVAGRDEVQRAAHEQHPHGLAPREQLGQLGRQRSRAAGTRRRRTAPAVPAPAARRGARARSSTGPSARASRCWRASRARLSARVPSTAPSSTDGNPIAAHEPHDQHMSSGAGVRPGRRSRGTATSERWRIQVDTVGHRGHVLGCRLGLSRRIGPVVVGLGGVPVPGRGGPGQPAVGVGVDAPAGGVVS